MLLTLQVNQFIKFSLQVKGMGLGKCVYYPILIHLRNGAVSIQLFPAWHWLASRNQKKILLSTPIVNWIVGYVVLNTRNTLHGSL